MAVCVPAGLNDEQPANLHSSTLELTGCSSTAAPACRVLRCAILQWVGYNTALIFCFIINWLLYRKA